MMTLDGRCILNTGKYCNIYIYHQHTGVGVVPSTPDYSDNGDMSLEVCVTMGLSISMTCVYRIYICGYPWVIVQLFILIQNHHFELDLQIDLRNKVWTIGA